MTIQELADRAAVTTRTIRYYVEQGVLPPPERGRPSEYTGEHLRLLDLVRRLKEQYLPLEEIRDILQRLTPDQVEDFLRRTEPPIPEPGPQDSAADYISQVLTRGALRAQLKEQAPPAPQPAPAPIPPPMSASPATQPAPYRRSVSVGTEAASKAAPSQESAVVAYEQQAAAPDDTGGPGQSYIAEERTWQRVTLAPGVELHYEAQAQVAQLGAIRRLIKAARTILGSHPEKGTEEQK